MNRKSNRWKLERASVHHKGAARAKSNKYTKNDADQRPAPHTRSKVWVGGYSRKDGTRIEGHFRFLTRTTMAKPVS